MTRQNFTPKTKAAIRERSGGVCEVHRIPEESRRVRYRLLPMTCKRPGAEVDHVHPDWADGPRTAENGAYLCEQCHSVKSVVDNKEAKKSNRLQGKTGNGPKRKIPSRPFQARKTEWPRRPMETKR